MIYFAQIGRDGPIKIGDSDDPARRLRELQTNVPWSLHLLLVLPGVPASQIYHDFSAARMKGEWFYPTRDLLAFIAKGQASRDNRSPESWKRSKRRFGSNLVLIRRIIDLCEDSLPPGTDSIEARAEVAA